MINSWIDKSSAIFHFSWNISIQWNPVISIYRLSQDYIYGEWTKYFSHILVYVHRFYPSLFRRVGGRRRRESLLVRRKTSEAEDTARLKFQPPGRCYRETPFSLLNRSIRAPTSTSGELRLSVSARMNIFNWSGKNSKNPKHEGGYLRGTETRGVLHSEFFRFYVLDMCNWKLGSRRKKKKKEKHK